MSHTKGPWMVHPLDRRAVVGPDGDSAIADVHTWRDTDDARLIAAAPELLTLVMTANSGLKGTHTSAWQDAARAAIAKATGENA